MYKKCSAWICGCVLIVSVANANQADREIAVEHAVEKLVRLLQQLDDDIDQFARELSDEETSDQLVKNIKAVRLRTKGKQVSSVELDRTTGQMIYELENEELLVDFGFTTGLPIRITSIAISTVAHNQSDAKPITWENLSQSMEQAAQAGFEGGVLVSRGGKIVFEQAYGYANRARKIKNTPNTVFAIGSAPIDFTHAGILLLIDRGNVSFDDTVSDYFANVPEDKRGITIKHLMTGQSGLRDFHDIPSDKNPDHSWIDRDEAVRRIMQQKLLFVPGKGRRDSHSAWGLLAAVIEIASKQTYPEFTREHLFEPAGMKDTGFFGDPIDEDRIAVGYGSQKASEPNSPPHWGQTSWLVMGSGGQVSTLADMYRWKVAMRNGSILSPQSAKIYLGNGDGLSQDGDMFGFEFMHSKNPDQLFMILSNTVATRQDRRAFDRLGRRLHALVSQR